MGPTGYGSHRLQLLADPAAQAYGCTTIGHFVPLSMVTIAGVRESFPVLSTCQIDKQTQIDIKK